MEVQYKSQQVEIAAGSEWLIDYVTNKLELPAFPGDLPEHVQSHVISMTDIYNKKHELFDTLKDAKFE